MQAFNSDIVVEVVVAFDCLTCCAGSKAVDCLIDSKWAKQVDEPIAQFIPYMGSRAIATEFCQK